MQSPHRRSLCSHAAARLGSTWIRSVVVLFVTSLGVVYADGPVGDHVNDLDGHLGEYATELDWLLNEVGGIVDRYESDGRAAAMPETVVDH